MNDDRDDDRSGRTGIVDPDGRDRSQPSSSGSRRTSDVGARSPSESNPPSGSDSTAGSPGSGPESSRGWTALAFALALVSLVTAAGTVAVHDAVLAAVGAATLALGFGAIGALAFTGTTRTTAALADGWAEHRSYVWFATGLFGLGTVLGGLLVAAGVDLTELLLEALMEEFNEEEFAGEGGAELSASFFIAQNTPPFVAAIFGALTLGLVTALIMLFNGVLIGNLAIVTGLELGFGPIVALLAPHGIFELPALFIASGVGFRFLHRAVQRVAGSREALFTKSYVGRTALIAGFGWLLLVLAAFIEAYLTIAIAEFFFPQLAD